MHVLGTGKPFKSILPNLPYDTIENLLKAVFSLEGTGKRPHISNICIQWRTQRELKRTPSLPPFFNIPWKWNNLSQWDQIISFSWDKISKANPHTFMNMNPFIRNPGIAPGIVCFYTVLNAYAISIIPHRLPSIKYSLYGRVIQFILIAPCHSCSHPLVMPEGLEGLTDIHQHVLVLVKTAVTCQYHLSIKLK